MLFMKSIFDRREWVLALGTMGILVLAYLAAGLRRIDFLPPRPLGFEGPDFNFFAGAPSGAPMDVPIWQQLVFWGTLIGLAGLVLSIFSSKIRKKVLKALVRFAIIFLTLSYVIKVFREQILPEMAESAAEANTPPLNVQADIFSAPDVPVGVNFLVSLLLFFGFILLTWMAWRAWQKRKGSVTMENLADIARDALQEMAAGIDHEHAIIQCYIRMNDAVSADKGLRRRSGMTPGEFAVRLEQAGLPARAVRRLTGLFESVRYGARIASQDEIQDARSCLADIVAACESP